MIKIEEQKQKIKQVENNIKNTINLKKKKELIKYKHRLEKELNQFLIYIRRYKSNVNKQ